MMARAHICVACGTQFAETLAPPPSCPICDDERQFVPRSGQSWTTLEELRGAHRNTIAPENGVTSVVTHPKFAIGQRSLVVAAASGNVLWDCVALLDKPTIAELKRHGGIRAIAISHPHYYTTMVEWSRAFDGAPIYLHSADREWIMRPDPAIITWDGEQRIIGDGLTLLRCGGHFDGGTVLHRASVADEPGALFTSDILTVTADRHVSFMRSYPNYIPLDADAVRKIVATVGSIAFDRIYGAFSGDVILSDARAVVAQSAQRYLQAISSE